MYFDFQLHFSLPISISRVSATWYWPFCPWFLPGLDPVLVPAQLWPLGLAHRSCPSPTPLQSSTPRCIAAAEVSTWWCCRRGSSPGRRAHSALCLEWLWCGRRAVYTRPCTEWLPTVCKPTSCHPGRSHLPYAASPWALAGCQCFSKNLHTLNKVLFHIFRKCWDSLLLPFLVFPTCNVLVMPLFYERSAHTL